jgi:hypothetical protein
LVYHASVHYNQRAFTKNGCLICFLVDTNFTAVGLSLETYVTCEMLK